FHGYAHGAEMPETASGLVYGLGFLAGTALLHAVGLGLGLVAAGTRRTVMAPMLGGTVAVLGVALLASHF
ncbi:urease accessory protein, partial [Methylobacterium sp. WL122]